MAKEFINIQMQLYIFNPKSSKEIHVNICYNHPQNYHIIRLAILSKLKCVDYIVH